MDTKSVLDVVLKLPNEITDGHCLTLTDEKQQYNNVMFVHIIQEHRPRKWGAGGVWPSLEYIYGDWGPSMAYSVYFV